MRKANNFDRKTSFKSGTAFPGPSQVIDSAQYVSYPNSRLSITAANTPANMEIVEIMVKSLSLTLGQSVKSKDLTTRPANGLMCSSKEVCLSNTPC